MAQDPGTGGLDVSAMIAQAMATGGAQTGPQQVFVPLWKVRPKSTKGVNYGEFGDELRTPNGGRIMSGRGSYGGPSASDYEITADRAASSFIDMDEKDRAEFLKKAIGSGLIKPGTDGVSQAELFEAWQRATNYAASYNGDRDQSSWISPWEAADRLGVSGVAGAGGAYDPFKPRTQTSTTRRNFTKGGDAEAVTRNLESIFTEEMGRAPTKAERATYQKLVQKAYDANPERSTTTSQTDANGNTTSTTNVAGGVDLNGTLLDEIRDTPEADAYQAGATFFDAAMRSLGAIA